MPEKNDAPGVQAQAAAIGNLPVLKKVRSTADIQKELVSMFYQVDQNTPGFASIALADMTAAGVNKSANAVDGQRLAEASANIVATIAIMQKTKETSSQVEGYSQTVNPMIA